MKQSAAARNPNQKKKTSPGIFSWILNATVGNAWRLLVWSILAVTLSIVTEWVGIAAGFWGVDHSTEVLEKEVAYLSGFNRNFLLGVYPADLAVHFLEYTHTFYDWIGLSSLSSTLANSTSSVVQAIAIGLQSAINITFIFATRLAISATSITGFILVALLGFMDGLTEREIRKDCGGIESAMVYHYSKRLIFPAIIFSFGLYLTLPISIHPLLIFIPAMGLVGYTIFIASSTFKKFL